MRMQSLISAGFATIAIASASGPALALAPWPDIDFEWYANVGKPLATVPVVITLAPREGYIVSPGHYETRGTRQVWVPAHYVKDDYQQQLVAYNDGRTTTYATGPFTIRDRDGNIIPTEPEAYPVDSALK